MQGTPFRTIHGEPLHLENLYLGASCFIVLSGPSLRELDLSLLRRRGVFTFAVNNAATVVRPDAWTFVDPPEKFHNSIWADPAVLKFVNATRLDWKLREKVGGQLRPLRLNSGREAAARDMPGVVSTVRNAYFNPPRWLQEPSINWGNSKRSARKNGFPRDLNVMLAALKIVYALGFRAVYLLGCDFRMDSARPYAFDEEKHAGAINCNNSKYRTITEMLGLLKPHFDAAGYRVFNANPRSGLTVFPFTTYSEAIEAATGHVPQEPLDTIGWYSKG
jgi:hypothetical protein